MLVTYICFAHYFLWFNLPSLYSLFNYLFSLFSISVFLFMYVFLYVPFFYSCWKHLDFCFYLNRASFKLSGHFSLPCQCFLIWTNHAIFNCYIYYFSQLSFYTNISVLDPLIFCEFWHPLLSLISFPFTHCFQFLFIWIFLSYFFRILYLFQVSFILKLLHSFSNVTLFLVVFSILTSASIHLWFQTFIFLSFYKYFINFTCCSFIFISFLFFSYHQLFKCL